MHQEVISEKASVKIRPTCSINNGKIFKINMMKKEKCSKRRKMLVLLLMKLRSKQLKCFLEMIHKVQIRMSGLMTNFSSTPTKMSKISLRLSKSTKCQVSERVIFKVNLN
jgi:hypothetical protein